MSYANIETLAGPIDDEMVDEELEHLIETANRQYADHPRVDGLPPSIVSPDTAGVALGEGSEPALRSDEKVCEVTNLTYYAGLPRSPHVDREGVPIW